ncbi:MFS transporter [Pedosphaera parvula]|uniref:MFS transporter n=1 Tax=Pedosphaera parvula TaxID=1032527 RepID=UPI00058DDD7E|nr:MFS transporter [Pedosphaera parvula]
MQKAIRRSEYTELAALFGLQFMALGIWVVPLSAVLYAHQLQDIRPYAFATSAVAAFVSPLIFGAMADHHASPVKVLRWLSVASAAAMLIVAWSIQNGWPGGLVLLLIQLYALCSAPTASISTAIIFSRLGNSRSEYGPVRAGATFGWMCGCWLISALHADASTLAQYIGAAVWLTMAAFTLLLPSVNPPMPTHRLSWKQRLGWDALTLLRNPDHRVVFITAALYSIPLAAFYAFTPPHLQQLGFHRLSAWMTLGQIMEILTLLALGRVLLRWRLKWIFLTALGFGVVRFALCALNNRAGLLAGILLHGLCYALYFITAQIYLDERVEVAWRARAQALMSLMTSGVGNLIGYLGTGWWLNACTQSNGVQWTLFWGGLSTAVGGVMIYFLSAYRGKRAGGETQ